jgi:DNA-binding MarR family transcriptional regulator
MNGISVNDISTVARAMQSFGRLRASRQVHAALVEAAGVELSQQETQVLLHVQQGGPVAEIARSSRMDMGAVSRQLRTLEESGLVRRGPSPDNGAVVLVTLTAKGRRTAERILAVRDGHLEAALSSWSPDDVARLGGLLQRLVDDLQNTPYPQARERVGR